MSRVQGWSINDNSIKGHQKKIHGVLELLWWVYSIVSAFAKSKTSGN
jgi:hypothetical protein